MADKTQIISQIRFQLDQLSAKNAHHEFEHLCRHLARERICSNIIPSTGPVSAGGDLGKDFGTFVTYLRSSPVSTSTFVGKISEGPIVFACSLQKKAIKSKIQADVKKIMKHGTEATVKSIVFFCATDIPIQKREKLKKWARKSFSVELEIHDGQSISELLADREIFWIAVQYLSIPIDIYPRTEQEDDWYIQSLESWRLKKKVRQNYADFFEIKSAIRHATFEYSAKQDLPFWISLLRQFIHKEVPPELRRSAIYEVAVASLRGLGTMNGQEEELRGYFKSIPGMKRSMELADVAALLNYCTGALFQNKVQLTVDEITTWRDQLLTKVEKELKQSRTPSQKCPLLEIRGYLSLSVDPRKPKHIDTEEAIELWTQLIDIAKDAPLFPLERFADRLTNYTRFIGNSPGYDYLSQQTDMLLSQRQGDFKAAEKCRDRAMVFYKMGKTLRAIDQLHKAKVKWFAEETIEGSVLSMLLISQSYEKLGLLFAAKYYALASASIALMSTNPEVNLLVPKAIIQAAECDYLQGSWCGYLDLAETGLKAYGIFSKDSTNSTDVDEFYRTIFHVATMIAITSVLNAGLCDFLKEKTEKWNIGDWLNKILPKAYSVWEKLEISEIWNKLEEQIQGRPFGDIGVVREVTWSELGITWKVSWKNDFETTPVAEQMIAVLQILLADLAGIDLCFLRTNVDINVRKDKISDIKVEPIPSNIGRKWQVAFPIKWSEGQLSLGDLQVKVLAIAITILTEISVLPLAEFNKILEERFREGISMKVFVAKPYEVLYTDFTTKEIFDSSDRSKKCIPEPRREFRIKENKKLSWVNGPGPGYSKKKAESFLKNRYSYSLIPIRHTLKRLLKHTEFASTIERLRQEGWLDWHLLASICNVTITYRARQRLQACTSPEAEKELYFKIMNEPERKDSPPIPIHEFTEDKLRLALKFSMISTIRILDLELRQETPDFEAIEHFLRHRYNYWTDDIDHADPFRFAS